MSIDNINVTVFNNEGTGFGESKSVDREVRIVDFVGDQVRNAPNQYTITVNGELVAANQRLHNGDKIVIMPKKHGGARETLRKAGKGRPQANG